MTLDEAVKYVVIISPILSAVLIVYAGKQANRDATRAAVASERVEHDIRLRDMEMTATLDTIHRLVNARLSEALNKIEKLELRIYQITGESPSGEPPRRTP